MNHHDVLSSLRLIRICLTVFVAGLWTVVSLHPVDILASQTHNAYDRAVPPLCENVCGSSADCNETCYADQFDFDQDHPTTCYAWGDYALPCCGDGLCDNTNEMPGQADSCSADCGTPNDICGDCTPGEANSCGSGYACNVNGCCVAIPNCPGSTTSSCQNPVKPTPPCVDSYCYVSSDCCPGDRCNNEFPQSDWLHGVSYGVCVPNVAHPSHSPAR